MWSWNAANESLQLQMVSDGLALRGMYLTKRPKDQLEKKDQLIEVAPSLKNPDWEKNEPVNLELDHWPLWNQTPT